ncbi:MAG: AAA family ATPase, partial [Armatimonadetes bacterium]|nr:AAA family ATPase [Armatimonadota bacterium]
MSFPHHESLTLTNFTAFAEARFEFSPGVNILVGEIGTGKTHLMKVLYAVQYVQTEGREVSFESLEQTLAKVFQLPRFGGIPSIVGLMRSEGFEEGTMVNGVFDDKPWEFLLTPIGGLSNLMQATNSPILMPRPVFIPAIDMMAHTRRFLSTYDNYDIAFDQTH